MNLSGFHAAPAFGIKFLLLTMLSRTPHRPAPGFLSTAPTRQGLAFPVARTPCICTLRDRWVAVSALAAW